MRHFPGQWGRQILGEALKAWQAQRFRDISRKLAFSICRKRSNGSRLSAWGGSKTLRLCTNPSLEKCADFIFGLVFIWVAFWALFGRFSGSLGAPWAPFGIPLDLLGGSVGYLDWMKSNRGAHLSSSFPLGRHFGSQRVLWVASGAPF